MVCSMQSKMSRVQQVSVADKPAGCVRLRPVCLPHMVRVLWDQQHGIIAYIMLTQKRELASQANATHAAQRVHLNAMLSVPPFW